MVMVSSHSTGVAEVVRGWRVRGRGRGQRGGRRTRLHGREDIVR